MEKKSQSLEMEPIKISLEAELFSKITLARLVLFFIVGSIAFYFAVSYTSPVAKGLAALIGLILFPISLLAHRQVRRDRIDRSVILTSVTWYLIAVAMIVVGERLYGVLIVCATMPVLMTMPFVSERLLKRIVVASLVLIITGSIGALYPPVITPTVPDQLIAYVESFATSALSCVVMMALWLSGGRLKAAAEGMRKAITALKESEKSLENKVEKRTSELEVKNTALEQAFREISDINEVAGIVNSTLDVDVVKNTIYDALQRMFSFDQMGVLLVDPQDQRLRLKLQAGVPFAVELEQTLIHDGLVLDASDSFVAAAVLGHKTIFVANVTASGLANAGVSDRLINEFNPMKSILLCPLEVEHKAIGALFLLGPGSHLS